MLLPMVMHVWFAASPFFVLDFANNLGVGDFLPASSRDLAVLDGEEGVGAFDVLAIVGTNADALA